MQENNPATTETPVWPWDERTWHGGQLPACEVCGAPMLPGFPAGLCDPCRAEREHLMREDDRERYEEGLQ